MNILSLSDRVIDHIYSQSVKDRYPDIDLVLGCGDLPYYYLEFVVDVLNVPVFYVRGNHAPLKEFSEHGEREAPWGATNLHRRTVNHKGLLLAGFEGSVRYRPGPFQYTQFEMWLMVFAMIPKLIINRVLFGRYLDVLISHTSPWRVNDQEDLAHHGFKAFRWLLKVFKPAYHFHGHIHNYEGNKNHETKFQESRVINTYQYRRTTIDLDELREQRMRKDE
jgi:Icc-related predicted phosphoesterase